MKRLSTLDTAFLLLEKRQQPMHVAGLQLFKFPKDAPRDFLQQLVDEFRNVESIRPPFNQRVVWRMGQAFWDEDPYFDLEHHFRHSALPKPGRVRELLDLTSRLHSNLLDRSRPLWSSRLIEGLQGRRFAMYNKIHHSVVDGVAAMRLGQSALTEDPNARGLLPMWAKNPADRRKPSRGNAVERVIKAGAPALSLGGITEQIGMARGVAGRVVEAMRGGDGAVSPFETPRCMLNVPITASRRFAAQSYSLTRIKAVGKALDCTVNDIVLAMCAAALRQYLLSLNALPAKSLTAMVPVSVRPEGTEGGNQIAMILANLGTNLADPLDRIEVIRASMQAGKDRFSQMSQPEIIAYTILSSLPSTLNLALGLAPERQRYNLVISNVPGPKKALYWNGAELEGMYPVSIPTDGQALNITCTSYQDSLDFGLTACSRTVPSVQRMLDMLEDALKELERVARA